MQRDLRVASMPAEAHACTRPGELSVFDLLILPAPRAGAGVPREAIAGAAGLEDVIRVAAHHAARGHWGEAAEIAREALLAARALGHAREESRLSLLLGTIQYRRGRWAEADAAWRSIGTGAQAGTVMHAGTAIEGGAELSLARLALRRGDRSGTSIHLQCARSAFEHAGDGDGAMLVASLGAEFAAISGRPCTADACLDRAAGFIADSTRRPILLIEWRLARAASALALRRWRDARVEARGSLDLLQDEAAGVGSAYSECRARVIELAATIGLRAADQIPLAQEIAIRHPAHAAGRWGPWIQFLAGNDAAGAIECLVESHRAFASVGEVQGELLTAIALTRAKAAAGAVRGALDWYRRAESASIRGIAPRRHASQLANLKRELETALAGRVDRHRSAASSIRPVRASARGVLDELLPRLGVRRAMIARLDPSDRVRPLVAAGGGWSDAELRAIPERLQAERLGRLSRGETVICADAAFHDAPGGAIIVPLHARVPGLTVLVLDGHAGEDTGGPGAEELVLAGVAADALAGAFEAEDDRWPSDGIIEPPVHFGRFITRHGVTRDMLLSLHRVASSDVPVLLIGETGTGKELLARALHERSGRPGLFVAQNCAAIPEALLEAEFFGHAAGAFTGAARARRGLLETAHRGTFFLDEIAEMTVPLQAKLLRALESGEVRALGENDLRRIETRLISATHRDLERELAPGRFRRDLFYRLSVMTVSIPPLRERPEDIPLLAQTFLHDAAGREGKPIPGFTGGAMESLMEESWPGNVRELENRVRRAVALAPPGEPISRQLMSPSGGSVGTGLRDHRAALREFERERILEALERADGNRTVAARLLGDMRRTTLLAKMKRLGIECPADRNSTARSSPAGPA